VNNPVPFGGDVFFSVTFTNTGNVTLTNIIINNDQPSNPTRLVGPISLAPNGFTNFTSSYTPINPCAPFPDTRMPAPFAASPISATTCANTPPARYC
jgi:uncharacterized repeat protein (TIGR01451 family)